MAKKTITEQELPLQEANATAASTRKRTRISKKEDHVYKATTEGQGERFDTDEQKEAAKNATPAIFAIDPATLVPPKKKPGRPSKAYLKALEEYNRQLALFEELKGGEVEIAPEAKQPEPVEEKEEASSIMKEENSSTKKEEAPAVKKEEAPTEDTKHASVEKEEKADVDMSKCFVVANDLIITRDLPTIEEERKRIGVNTSTPKFRKFSEDSNQNSTTLERANTQAAVNAAKNSATKEYTTPVEGVLELEKDNSGYLRSADYNYLPSADDVQVSSQFIRQYALHTGDTIEGLARLPKGSERAYVLTTLTQVNGKEARKVRDRAPFESLIPLFPDEKFQLCGTEKDSMSCRIVDLFSPIGKGQRALIVAQPKTGKTLLMKDIANAIARNHPETHLIMLLIDERPEEVTDMARTVDAEVIASTFDEPASQHVRIANIVLEKAKRMVECGHDVVIFLDSITRLARAYNTVAPGSGKILTGGVDANALQKPKRFFGAARNIENGGSLTIIATALIDTGSKMDEVIFEEFKGTGNMELQLERTLANKRMFPAVNLMASSTRRDDLLLDDMTQNRMWVLRNYIADMNPIEAMKFLLQRLENTKDNKEFVISINS